MKRSKVHKYSFVLMAMLSMFCFYATAQSFRYKATLDSVQQSSFYTIPLSPAVVAECQPQFGDIRIKDDAGKEISYILKQQTTANNSFDALPQPAIMQHDSSDKKSYIQLLFGKYYQINKLRFSLSGAKFFNRSFTLYDGSDNALLASGNVTSRDSSITINMHVKTNTLLLVINNLDNTPLRINKLAVYQLPVAVIAYLDAGKKYSLFFGDSSLNTPAYDLQYFSDSIRAGTRVLAIKSIEKITVPAGTKTNVDNHIHTWLLWSIIIAVLLMLIYFSFALIKDINQKNTNTDAHL
ncbi:hypothetical protein FC093_06105 [Ilyomonas limi]|uniref:DUF3999 domain-containing protein n=1 Tax=Ilyomonas limi TaxID=2575867 RepID=A0A4U3L593_9BACT|nr:hypothetical protein [Ilyomonas limi]TKK70315.1 hypothetical protein FC093_06105 [Ilyomonas limi]